MEKTLSNNYMLAVMMKILTEERPVATEDEILGEIKASYDSDHAENPFVEDAVQDMDREQAKKILTILRNLLAKKRPLITEAEIHQRCRSAQMADAGLVDKEAGHPIEEGDTIIMSFVLYEGDTVVEDQSKQDMAYRVGTKGIPCDDGMIGMSVGESRYFDVVFGEGLVKKHLVGRSLRMLVRCKGIKIGRPAPKQP